MAPGILLAGVVSGITVATGGPALAAPPVVESFTTAGCTTWTAPADIHPFGALQVVAIGAAGAPGESILAAGGAGGAGDQVSASLAGLEAGDSLRVCVAVGGGAAGPISGPATGVSGAGGGASGVSLGTNFASPVVIAAGGGGGTGSFFGFAGANGGAAGSPAGANGVNSTDGTGGGGQGGDQTSPGAAGTSGYSTATSGGATGASGPGTGGTGGGGTFTGFNHGGGGGGGAGYFGGGGGGEANSGTSGGGGGGSDFCAATVGGVTVTGCTVASGVGTATSAGSEAGFARVTLTYNLDDRPAPTIATVASPGGSVGSIAITATTALTGTVTPTGDVTFHLFSDSACLTEVFNSTKTLANGTATSAAFTPTSTGTYYWTATYPGDANNNVAASACQAQNTSVTITDLPAPTIATVASPGGSVGTTAITATTTLTGTVTPTGDVTFHLFSDSACLTEVFNSTKTLANGTATSAAFTPTSTGTYYWTATYPGDANNNVAASACQAQNTSVTITDAVASTATANARAINAVNITGFSVDEGPVASATSGPTPATQSLGGTPVSGAITLGSRTAAASTDTTTAAARSVVTKFNLLNGIVSFSRVEVNANSRLRDNQLRSYSYNSTINQLKINGKSIASPARKTFAFKGNGRRVGRVEVLKVLRTNTPTTTSCTVIGVRIVFEQDFRGFTAGQTIEIGTVNTTITKTT